jgi:hypothetical protein
MTTSSTNVAHPPEARRQARARIARIQRELASLDYVCSGTLVKRWKLCGKPGCRCRQSPGERHGPYFEWGYMEAGRQVHRMITPTQARLVRAAIRNYRRALRLLRSWEDQTARILEAEDDRNP